MLVLERPRPLDELSARQVQRVEDGPNLLGLPDLTVLGEVGPKDRLAEGGEPGFRSGARQARDPGGEQAARRRLMPPRGYVALPRRWVVERSFSWPSQNRRMSKDYEGLCASAEAFVYAAMIRLIVRRLARA